MIHVSTVKRLYFMRHATKLMYSKGKEFGLSLSWLEI